MWRNRACLSWHALGYTPLVFIQSFTMKMHNEVNAETNENAQWSKTKPSSKNWSKTPVAKGSNKVRARWEQSGKEIYLSCSLTRKKRWGATARGWWRRRRNSAAENLKAPPRRRRRKNGAMENLKGRWTCATEKVAALRDWDGGATQPRRIDRDGDDTGTVLFFRRKRGKTCRA